MATGGHAVSPPDRAVFGLPHNYYFKGSGNKVNVDPEGFDRRASPLFFHVHQPKEQAPTAVLLFLPARFLPENKLRIGRPGQRPDVVAMAPDPWRPVHEFLDRIKDPTAGPDKLCIQFPGAAELSTGGHQ